MKIRKKYIFVVALLLVLPVAGKKISKADKLQKILEKIDKSANKIKTFTAKFKQIDLDPMFDELEETYGKFVFQKLKENQNDEPIFKFRFDYKKPERSITIVNESKVIIFTPKMKEPQESYMVDKVKLQIFLACFLSKEKIEENYEVILENISSKKVTLQLVPKTQAGKKHFRDIRITFNAITWLPSVIHQTKNNSQQITIMFKNIHTNQIISPQTFTVKSLKNIY